jgi:hypothetical protein
MGGASIVSGTGSRYLRLYLKRLTECSLRFYLVGWASVVMRVIAMKTKFMPVANLRCMMQVEA